MKFKRSHKRHIAKSLTWRGISIVITTAVAWCVTGNPLVGLTIGGADAAVKMALYYYHERVWHIMKKKKRREKFKFW